MEEQTELIKKVSDFLKKNSKKFLWASLPVFGISLFYLLPSVGWLKGIMIFLLVVSVITLLALAAFVGWNRVEEWFLSLQEKETKREVEKPKKKSTPKQKTPARKSGSKTTAAKQEAKPEEKPEPRQKEEEYKKES